jgi:hypothetical protein
MSMSLAPARAAASRRNGAKSHGPKTAVGKARASQNALKHGLCAHKHVVLNDEDARAFAALEATLLEELAPEGILQRLLAGRIVRAAWRLERAERIEAELFANRLWDGGGDLALALIRDGHGTRSFDMLLRYRGSALAEFFQAVRLLKALQDEARTIEVPEQAPVDAPPRPQRNEPNSRRTPGPMASPADTPCTPPQAAAAALDRLESQAHIGRSTSARAVPGEAVTRSAGGPGDVSRVHARHPDLGRALLR